MQDELAAAIAREINIRLTPDEQAGFNHGEQAEMMKSIFDSDGGWMGTMSRFAAQAAGAVLSTEAACSADQLTDQTK